MEYFVIGIVSFLTSVLTFFSGFGIGTILTPIFILFFPIEVAVATTAIVHFLNNLFKFSLTYKDIDKSILFKFGLPAIPSAVFGAWLLVFMAEHNKLIARFSIVGLNCEIYTIQLIVGVIMLFFAVAEIVPSFKQNAIQGNYLFLGGIVSGFFGGLTGHQGAFRTMFLIKSNLTKNGFIATGIAIACLVDISRISIYSNKIANIKFEDSYTIVLTALISALIGAYLGKILLRKVTISFIQYIVAILIGATSVLLILGII